MHHFQGKFIALLGLDIRNSLCHLDLSNDTVAEDLVHFMLAHLGEILFTVK
jgi:hypothetical protein